MKVHRHRSPIPSSMTFLDLILYFAPFSLPTFSAHTFMVVYSLLPGRYSLSSAIGLFSAASKCGTFKRSSQRLILLHSLSLFSGTLPPQNKITSYSGALLANIAENKDDPITLSPCILPSSFPSSLGSSKASKLSCSLRALFRVLRDASPNPPILIPGPAVPTVPIIIVDGNRVLDHRCRSSRCRFCRRLVLLLALLLLLLPLLPGLLFVRAFGRRRQGGRKGGAERAKREGG